jgi:hypothetical protein
MSAEEEDNEATLPTAIFSGVVWTLITLATWRAMVEATGLSGSYRMGFSNELTLGKFAFVNSW